MQVIKIFLICLFMFFCKPADPNYRIKPLLNQEYSGFISRSFFQVVIEVPITKEEVSILEEREICKKEANIKKDSVIIPLLKKIALETKENEELKKRETTNEVSDNDLTNTYRIIQPETESKKYSLSKPNATTKTFLNKGEFSWFLDSMFLFKEDYSAKNKCIFIYRKIEKGLFAKVENTKLGIVRETSTNTEATNTQNPNVAPTGTGASTSPLGTGIQTLGR